MLLSRVDGLTINIRKLRFYCLSGMPSLAAATEGSYTRRTATSDTARLTDARGMLLH